jgi:hypothetical protein
VKKLQLTPSVRRVGQNERANRARASRPLSITRRRATPHLDSSIMPREAGPPSPQSSMELFGTRKKHLVRLERPSSRLVAARSTSPPIHPLREIIIDDSLL